MLFCILCFCVSAKRFLLSIAAPSLLVAAVGFTPITQAAEENTRTVSYDYDPASGLLTKEAIEPSDAHLMVTRSYGYDSYRIKTSVSAANAFRAVDGLLSTAAGAGATSARIEASMANSSLQLVLVERYGAQLGKGPGGAYQDALTFTVKR